MSRTLSKKQRSKVKQKNKNRKIKKTEVMDAKGIRKKKWKNVISYRTFVKMKIVGIVLIPIVYFIYSPLLIVVMVYYISLYYFAYLAERSMNKSIIKSRQIKIPKFDSGLAAFLVVIALLGSISGLAQGGRFGRFANTWWSRTTRTLQNIGSLLTGNRIFFGDGRSMRFGSGTPPAGFIPNREGFGNIPPPENMGSGRPPMNLDIGNLPIEFMFSQILSTTLTILVFTVFGMGILSLWMTHVKVRKFNQDIYDVIPEGEISILSDDEMEKIVSFGEDEI